MKIKGLKLLLFAMLAGTKISHAKAPISLRFLVESTYNDALFYREGDFVTFLNPSISLFYKRRKLDISGTLELRQLLYRRFTHYNDTGYGGSFSSSFAPIENLSFAITALRTRGSTLTPRAGEFLGIWTQRRAVYVEDSISGRLNLKIKDFATSLSYRADEFKFPQAQEDNNRGRSINMRLRWERYRVQPHIRMGSQRRDYPRRGETYKSKESEIGIVWERRGYTFSASAGRALTEEPTKNQYITWGASVRRALAKGILAFSYTKSVSLRADIADVVKSTLFSVEGGRLLLPKTIIFCFLGYGMDEFLQQGREDRIWVASLGLRLRMRRWLSPLLLPFAKRVFLMIRYDFIKRDSTDPAYSHRNNIYTMRVSTHL